MSEEISKKKEKKFETLLIFGPPGSGKGTVSKSLKALCGFYHLSSGDVFRGLSPDSPSGKIFHQYASKGNLVPDDVTIQIWHSYVNDLIQKGEYAPERQFLLLDGIPRTKAQAECLDAHIEIQKIIVLDNVDEEALFARMQKRAGEEGRMDDADLDVLKNRMSVYHKETKVVLDHYSPEHFARIDASQSPEKVLKDVLAALEGHLDENTAKTAKETVERKLEKLGK